MALFRSRKDVKPDILKDTSEEYFRTNTNMSVDKGDAPSFQRVTDPRLPKLFKFEYGGQNGWIVIPKGRIVSIVPDRTFKDFDDNKFYPAVTLANGGVDVVESNDDPESDQTTYERVANKPVGVSYLNTYQSLDDEFAGNVPGFVTRNTINLPLFDSKANAEKTEWGGAYGSLKPGDKVMSDENGRFVAWKEGKLLETEVTGLSSSNTVELPIAIMPGEEVADVTVIDLADGTTELTVASIDNKAGTVTLDSAFTGDVKVIFRSTLTNAEQVVGMVLSVDENLIPAGWLKWVMPSENYEEPTGFSSGDLSDEGYPYDPSYGDFSKERPTGIPGLTDGMNYIKEYSGADSVTVDTIHDGFSAGDTVNMRLKESYLPVKELMTLTVGGTDIEADGYSGDTTYTFDSETGLLRISLASDTVPADGTTNDVVVEFKATHQMPGMPTHIDFEGVIGSVDILLQL